MQTRRVLLAVALVPARAENPVPVRNSAAMLAESLDHESDEVQRQLADRHNWNHERLAREIHRPEALLHESDLSPAHIALRRTRALLDHLRTMDGAPDLTEHAAGLDALENRLAQSEVPADAAAQRALFREIAALRRRIAFSNSLLDFKDILFIKRHRALYQHMCDQYYGIAAHPGSGLYVLEDAFGPEPRVREVLAGAVVERGRLKGESLRGDGSARGLRYDGSGLEQLSDGPWNDIHPCWLPDDDIAFISERRGGFLRCGRACPVYTLHRMDAHGGRGQVFGTPWPLDEDFYLTVYDPGQKQYAMVLADAFGNRDLLYLDPAIGTSDPIPLRARPVPPIIPDQTHYAAKPGAAPATGTVSVTNVYDSLLPWPEGTRLKELRLIQVFPKSTPAPDVPWIGSGAGADHALTRGVIGVVPVEQDGSAHFEMPAGVPFYMQALDERGMAVQTMRSVTYLHPGERRSCVQAPSAPRTRPLRRRSQPRRPPAHHPLAGCQQPVLWHLPGAPIPGPWHQPEPRLK